jgi:hypothetical protein
MSFDKLIEQIINEGIRNGEFDNLEGQGRPVDLDTYFSVPEDLRAGFSILKNAKVIPAEMEVLKQVNELKSRLEGCTDATERKELSRKLNDATLRFNLLMDSYRRRSRLG